MSKFISKLLCAAALAMTSVGSAYADVLTTGGFEINYQPWLTPVSVQSNSVTFSFVYPLYTYDDDGYHTEQQVFLDIKADASHSLTGKMQMQTTASYVAPEGTANLYGRFTVYNPHCDTCGYFDADVIDETDPVGTSSHTADTLQYTTAYTEASGTYKNLILVGHIEESLSQRGTQMLLNTVTIFIDTVAVQASPVPDLPPLTMLPLGLAVIGLSAGLKRRGQRPPRDAV